MACNYRFTTRTMFSINLELGRKGIFDEGKPCQSPRRMKNSSYYIAPVGVRTHDLPHTIASNMGKVSHALTYSATAAVFATAAVHDCIWYF